jgi:hypothetical protein
MQNISRIDSISRNGGDGLHYEIVPPCYQHYPKDDDMQKLVNGCVDCVWLLHCFVPKEVYDNSLCTA